MSKETVSAVQDMVAAAGVVDITEWFEQMWELSNELWAKIENRFELNPDPGVAKFAEYGTYPDSAGGKIEAFTGPELDWAVHSWLGNPPVSFSNIHVTVWLGPQIDVPHFGLAFATIPDLWFYIDSVPRKDLMVDLDYLDRYYKSINDFWLETKRDDDLRWFTSLEPYVRQALSDTALCYSADRTPENMEKIRTYAHAHLDRWLGWVDAAEPVPADRRAELAERDLQIRRNIAERDPANVIGVKYFGEEMTGELVRALWGGDRELPRPT